MQRLPILLTTILILASLRFGTPVEPLGSEERDAVLPLAGIETVQTEEKQKSDGQTGQSVARREEVEAPNGDKPSDPAKVENRGRQGDNSPDHPEAIAAERAENRPLAEATPSTSPALRSAEVRFWEVPFALVRIGIPLRPDQRARLSPYARMIGVREEDLILAAKVTYFEAGSYASEEAHRAVLSVLYNRCMALRFGGEITDIPTEVYRKGQFSVTGNPKFKTQEPPKELVDYARDVFLWGNISLPEDVLFFHASFLGKDWGGRRVYANIGGNLFFYGRME